MQVLTRAPYVRVYTREGVHTHVSTPTHSAFHQDERDQVLTLYLWIRQEWTDAYLRWDPDAYGGLDAIRIPSSLVWRPDIVLYNKYCLPPPTPRAALGSGCARAAHPHRGPGRGSAQPASPQDSSKGSGRGRQVWQL